MNTWLIKGLSHLPTFYSGSSKTQIDCIPIKRGPSTTVTDCKAVPYEIIPPQHRPFIAVLRIEPPLKQYKERTGPPRIKWWGLRGKKEEMISLARLVTIVNLEESGSKIIVTIHKAAFATLEVTKPDKRYIDRDTWLGNVDVEMKVREKKCLYHKFLDNKTLANWEIHKNANRDAKKSSR